jgi:signal transduction histidine kinase
LRHDAVLAIESEPGKGSTFIVKFPQTAVCEAEVERV